MYPIPGATPSYPGWEGAQPGGEPPPGRQAPSRYDHGEPPNFAPPGATPGGPPPGQGPYAPPPPPPDQEPTIPGTMPSSPYGGPPGYPPPPSGAPYGAPGPGYDPQAPGSGLATAALVLGVASPFLVFVCGTGLITAILSIVFGCVALAKRAGKGRAIAGIAISVLSLILFAIVAIWFWDVLEECAQLPGQLADRCFERRFPWMNGGR